MRAILLVGGEGTRLRPLTETIPKPLIPLVDRPFLDHLLDHLARHDVDEVVLSSPYLRSSFDAFLARRRSGPTIRWIHEEEPLGTGGAVANAARALDDGETALVLNGDILTDLDLTAVARSHRERQAAVTITLSDVEDARAFGLVRLDDDDRVLEFSEKPEERVSGLVNAGTYVIDTSVLRDVPTDRAVSIEREVFPRLIERGAHVAGFVSTAYWMDLGTREKYLRATFDVLEGRIEGLRYSAPHVDATADVSLRASLGRWVVVGPGVALADGAQIEDAVVLARASVGAGAVVRDSIVGPRARIAGGAVVEGAVVAEGAEVTAGGG